MFLHLPGILTNIEYIGKDFSILLIWATSFFCIRSTLHHVSDRRTSEQLPCSHMMASPFFYGYKYDYQSICPPQKEHMDGSELFITARGMSIPMLTYFSIHLGNRSSNLSAH